MVADGRDIGGHLEQLTHCDGSVGYMLQVSRPAGSNTTACQNMTLPDTRTGLCQFTPFWDFPANASYQGVDTSVRAANGAACDWWMYWAEHEQYALWADGSTPVRTGKLFTTVPGYLPWNITFYNFTSATPPASMFYPPRDLPQCTVPPREAATGSIAAVYRAPQAGRGRYMAMAPWGHAIDSTAGSRPATR